MSFYIAFQGVYYTDFIFTERTRCAWEVFGIKM